MSTTNVYPTSARGPVEHDVRQQIVTAAKEHFSRYGYEKTTVSDLAKAIGFSKAYIYKFFESKQVIGEMICSNCLMEMEAEIRQAVASTDAPPEQLRRLFKAIVAATLRLFSEDRKLYEIAISASAERWQSAQAYEEGMHQLLLHERKTPLDETGRAIFLVMLPYLNPVMLQHSLDHADEAPAQLAGLVLRSLSP